MRIPVTRPVIGQPELDAVSAVLLSGQLVQGRNVAEFERRIADRVGVGHAIAVTNCTAALHVGLMAMGVGPGDRVAVAPYSWVATANVIALCGATPVFVDVDVHTFNLDPARLDELLSSDVERSVKVVLPVHTFGNPAGFTELAEVCSRHGRLLLEDAACALGASELGRAAGSFGDAACFSFHPRKIITTGEGGMLTTDDDDIATFARSHRNHGQRMIDDVVEFAAPGDNLRLTEFQAAMGIAQMDRLDDLVAARARLATRYDSMLGAIGVTPQRRAPDAAVQSYVCTLPEGIAAGPVIATLRADGVEATIGTNAIPFTRYFAGQQGLSDGDLPATAYLRDHALTLPLFPGMSDDQQDDVVATLSDALG
jgi:perosamine synthetase